MLTLVKQPELSYSELLDAELYRRNLKKFVVAAWPLIDPAPFVDGYHIDAICEHLEAVSRGEILRLLINMPPRHAKSSIVSVLWRVWSWINDPGEQWLCASYVQDLAERDNRRCRNVIEHYWFQERYGHLFKLTRDQNEKANFDNDKGGYHICTAVGARTGTGKGGDRLLCLCYNTEVTTDKGRIPVGEIVECELPVRVLAFDHTSNTVRWQPIEKYEVSPGRSSVRVMFEDGRFVDATDDHPFYVVGRGYVPASQLTNTDEILVNDSHLRELRQGIQSPVEGYQESKTPILQSCMSRQMGNRTEQSRLSRWQSRTYLQKLWKGIYSQAQSFKCSILFKKLSGYLFTRSAISNLSAYIRQLCVLWQGNTNYQAFSGQAQLLYAPMCQSSTQRTDARRGQRAFCRWNGNRTVFQGISQTCSIDQRTRWSEVRSLPSNEKTEWQGIRCTSHRLRQGPQRANEFSISLPLVSRKDAWSARNAGPVERLLVRCVKPLATPEHVYNLRIAEDHNYFANGVLVHNCDDPHPAHDGSLERKAVSRENALTWFKETWQSRLNDREKGAMVVVGQRIHQNDISGHILEQGGWEHLNLPAEFVPERRCSTSVVGNIWKGTDWRKLEGELLWKEKFSQESLDTLKHDMTILPYSCQFQQAPVPPGGFIFEQQYERWFTIDQEANLYLLETPDGIKPVVMTQCKIIITSDVAAKAKEQSDFTVFCVWAITPAKEILLLYVFRGHLRIPKQIEEGYKTYQAYRDDRFQAFHFEDVAYQGAFGQFMMEKGVPCEEFHPKGDKVVRAGGASIWMKLGNFYWLKNLVGLDVCRTELYNFNKDVHDDFVDNVSQICIIVKESKDIEPMDEETANVLREYAGY